MPMPSKKVFYHECTQMDTDLNTNLYPRIALIFANKNQLAEIREINGFIPHPSLSVFICD